MNTELYKNKLEELLKLAQEDIGKIAKEDERGDWEAVPESDDINQEVIDEADMAERAEDFETRSIEVRDLEIKISNIKKSLEKIENGTFGKCEVCGKKIESDRLEANVEALTCKECMNKS